MPASVVVQEAGTGWSGLDDVDAEALRRIFVAVELGQARASGLPAG